MAAIYVIGPPSLFRSGLVSLLGKIGFDSIGEMDSVRQLNDGTDAKPSPGALVICWVRAVEETCAAVNETRAWDPAARVVVVVPTLDLDVMRQCFAAGAYGYLLERLSCDALRESLKLVKVGEKVFPSELALLFPQLTTTIHNTETTQLPPPLDNELSRREIEILRCLTSGQSNKVIAKNLQIAEATVKIHIKRILRKAHVINRTQAALWGIATGVASTPSTYKAIG